MYIWLCVADVDIAAGLFACAFQAAFYVPHIPTGNRDSSKKYDRENSCGLVFFLPIPFFMIPFISIPVCCHMEYYGKQEHTLPKT